MNPGQKIITGCHWLVVLGMHHSSLIGLGKKGNGIAGGRGSTFLHGWHSNTVQIGEQFTIGPSGQHITNVDRYTALYWIYRRPFSTIGLVCVVWIRATF